MANTEIRNALKQVRTAEKEIAEKLIAGGLTDEEQNLLQDCRSRRGLTALFRHFAFFNSSRSTNNR
jgi:hypothetical protein